MSWLLKPSSRLHGVVRGRLGQCPLCLRIATWGTLAGGALAVFARLLHVHPWIQAFVFLVAGGFLLALLVHLTAFAFWAAAAFRGATRQWRYHQRIGLVLSLVRTNLKTALFGSLHATAPHAMKDGAPKA